MSLCHTYYRDVCDGWINACTRLSSRCLHYMEKTHYVPLNCLRPYFTWASGVFECLQLSRHSISRVISTYTPSALRTRDCNPQPPPPGALPMILSTIKSSAPRSLLLKFLRSLNCFCFF